MSVPEDDAAAIPLGDDEVEAIAVRATVALETPPGSVAPDPRPRRDALEEAYEDVLRLAREVRRHRERARRWKDALRSALGEPDPGALRRTAGDLLDELL